MNVDQPKRVLPARPGRDVPAYYHGIADAAVRSRAAAVKLFCLECVGYVRADVSNCTAYHCPLYRWRPYQGGADDAAPPRICGPGAPEDAIGDPDRFTHTDAAPSPPIA